MLEGAVTPRNPASRRAQEPTARGRSVGTCLSLPQGLAVPAGVVPDNLAQWGSEWQHVTGASAILGEWTQT